MIPLFYVVFMGFIMLFLFVFSFFIPIIGSDAKNASSTDLTVQTADRMYCLF